MTASLSTPTRPYGIAYPAPRPLSSPNLDQPRPPPHAATSPVPSLSPSPAANTPEAPNCATGGCNAGDVSMKLLTKEIRKRLPGLHDTERHPDPVAVVKFFMPGTSWTLYATEFDREDTFFGLIEGFETELGYFSLSELESAQGPAGLKVERDRYFKPTPLSRLKGEGS